MDNHKKKMIAPIVVTVLVVGYYLIYFGILIALFEGIWKYALGIFPLLFAVVMLKVCIERIKEIRQGEEDDSNQY